MVGTRKIPQARTPRIKKGDKVVVISGAGRSNEPHEVLKVLAETGQVVLKEVNMRWKHTRRSQQSPQGGRVQKEFPIDISNVLLFSEKAGKGVRVRIETQAYENAAGKKKQKKIRVGLPCGTKFD